jgi:hypothetical protein
MGTLVTYGVLIKETGKVYERLGRASAQRLVDKINASGQHAKIING